MKKRENEIYLEPNKNLVLANNKKSDNRSQFSLQAHPRFENINDQEHHFLPKETSS